MDNLEFVRDGKLDVDRLWASSMRWIPIAEQLPDEERQWLLDDVAKFRGERNALRQIEAAARNLIKVKGRHHTEQAMKALIEAVNSQTF